MKLWLVTRTDKIGYDEYTGYVIAAGTEANARAICAQNAADEGSKIWLLESTRAIPIAEETNQAEGIVLDSFNAG